MVEENPGGAEKNDGPAGRKSFIPIYPDTLPTVPKPPKSSRTASLVFSDLPASQGAITRFFFAKPLRDQNSERPAVIQIVDLQGLDRSRYAHDGCGIPGSSGWNNRSKPTGQLLHKILAVAHSVAHFPAKPAQNTPKRCSAV